MGTYFLAGIYGVGKSTIGEKLSAELDIPFYSAGDLISKVNGERYGATKVVTDKDKNQDILAVSVSACLEENPAILLAGHFCIVNREGGVEALPEDVFEKLQIEKIILLEADVETIIKHLGQRDAKLYSDCIVRSLASTERMLAMRTAQKLGCPLRIHQMTYTETDIFEISAML